MLSDSADRFHLNPAFAPSSSVARSPPASPAYVPLRRSTPLNMVLKDPTGVGGPGGAFTATNAESRRIVPENPDGRPVMKIVYVVLESQYQSSMTGAVKRINAGSKNMAVECVGYLLEELRNEDAMEQFKKDVQEANVFIGSLIFVQELAEKVVEVVQPERERLDAVLVFPSMPEVSQLSSLTQRFTLMIFVQQP